MLLRHSVAEWLATLERIWYKVDTIRWFKILSTGVTPLTIEEYVPKGFVPEALFLLNPWGGHKVALYWAHGIHPKDYVRPWVMTKETSARPGYYTLLTDKHHYAHQHIIDAPNSLGNMLRPSPTAPITHSLPILRSSSCNHLPPPSNSPAPEPPLSSLDLPTPVPF